MFVLAVIASLFILGGYYISSDHSFIASALSINRASAIGVVWLITIFTGVIGRWRQKPESGGENAPPAPISTAYAPFSTSDTHDRLLQAQKMESLGQLTDGIAHDFNNLLAIILGNLDIMEERVAADDPLQQLIEPGIQAALHGSELTRRLLGFSRKRTFQPRDTFLNEEISAFSEWLKHILTDRIEVVLSLDPDLFTVHIDPVQLQNVLLTLSINARDNMPDGGKLVYEKQRMSSSIRIMQNIIPAPSLANTLC